MNKRKEKPPLQPPKEKKNNREDSELKKFEIWSEGYACTGQSDGAMLHGKIKANSFKEACIKFFTSGEDKEYFDPDQMTYWGCKLFDNEKDARKSFG